MNDFIEHLKPWQFDKVISPLKGLSVHQSFLGFFAMIISTHTKNQIWWENNPVFYVYVTR